MRLDEARATPPCDGGPAYPSPNFEDKNGGMHWGSLGMSLRDVMAKAALSHIPELLRASDKNRSLEMIADWSYEMADQMLLSRAKSYPELDHSLTRPEAEPVAEKIPSQEINRQMLECLRRVEMWLSAQPGGSAMQEVVQEVITMADNANTELARGLKQKPKTDHK